MSQSKTRVAVLLFMGIATLYYERTSISQLMVPISRELALSKLEQGWLFSAFSWGYVAFMLPGGFLVRHFGGWRCFQIGVSLSAILCAGMAICSSFQSLFAVRFLLGAAEAPVFPACAAIVADRFQIGAIAKGTACFDSGSYLGGAVVGASLPFLAATIGWRLPFVCAVLPALAIVFCSMAGQTQKHFEPSASRVPMRADRSIWGLFLDCRFIGAALAFVTYNFVKGFFLTWLPVLLVEGRGYDVFWTTLISSSPFALAIGAEFLSAHYLDRMDSLDTRWLRNRQRIVFGGLAVGGLIGALGISESRLFCMLVMVLSFCGLIAVSPALWAIPRELVANRSDIGVAGGFINFVSNVGGIISPIMLGSMLQNGSSLEQVSAVLSCACGLGMIGSLCLLWKRSVNEPIVTM